MPYEYIATPDGLLTTPPGSPKIMIHTRQGKVVGIYCDQPAKVLVVENNWPTNCPEASPMVPSGKIWPWNWPDASPNIPLSEMKPADLPSCSWVIPVLHGD